MLCLIGVDYACIPQCEWCWAGLTPIKEQPANRARLEASDQKGRSL